MIIVNIDGPNGVGKTTVVNEVMKHFNIRENTHTEFVHFHRRNTPIGELIQKVLNGEVKMDPMVFQMLYSADRLDFSKNYIGRYQSSKTKILLVDRYLTSGIAYGMSDGINPLILKDFDKHTIKPNINIILTAPADVLIQRLKTQKLNNGETGDIYEEYNKLDKILKAYCSLHGFINYVKYVDANKPLSSVVSEVISIIHDVREDDFQICSLD